uniref:RING-type domain-containing protein n=1 Tax=Kalanchoe fedtschenkoi TaxID=63787 RepID=A0A7N0UKA6_KALFE
MLLSIFLALLLSCAGASAVFTVYLCLLWHATSRAADSNPFSKLPPLTGLSPSDIEKLPKTNGHGLVLGSECAVCLDKIEPTDAARLLPGCNHGFHLQCADAWLSKHSVCPLCRSKIEPELVRRSPENDNPC